MPESDADRGPVSSELGLGERLRSARKASALSLEQVAESLHLDESVILALEDERYEALGAPVYVRGHLRTYARLVGLPVDSILAAYGKAEPGDDSAPIVARGGADDSVSANLAIWIFGGLVVLVGFALALYVLRGDPVEPVAVRSPVVAPVVPPESAPDATEQSVPVVRLQVSDSELESAVESTVEADGVAELQSPAEPVVDTGLDPVAGSEDLEPAPTIDAKVPPAADPSARTVRLSLHFVQESWVEIYDANGRLLFGLEREGRRRELTGEPPIQLVFGNGGGIDLRVNDEPYAIPVSRPDRATRFEIDPEMAQ
jgi:cytoskeleton protein RodZ